MSPLQASCPQGVEAVYAVENEWHKSVRIADYICNSALEGQCESRTVTLNHALPGVAFRIRRGAVTLTGRFASPCLA